LVTASGTEVKSQLRREMNFWDVLFFNIATVLGPRWIATAANSGPSSLTIWTVAALFFFIPTALIIVELSTRYPAEGGLYIWAREAFGEFHGFVAGWAYWTYTMFYFPGLLLASASMAAYIGGDKTAYLHDSKPFLLIVCLLMLAVAVWLNIIGLNIGKWLQNAGGVGTYIPLMMLVGMGLYIYLHHGSQTPIRWSNVIPTKRNLDLDTMNFWASIAFAFTGLELCSAMSEEVKNPQKTIPRAVYAAGIMIAVIYILGTIAVMVMVPAESVDPKSGVFQAIHDGSALLGIAFFSIVAALLVTVGNAGGVGSTVAGISRVPFVVGIDHYLPAAFGKIHPKWKTPWVSILVQAIISAAILLGFGISEKTKTAYEILINATIILYFLPFLYMYAAVIKLVYRPDRQKTPGAILIPGGKAGVWIVGFIAFFFTVVAMIVSVFPPGEIRDSGRVVSYEIKLCGSAIVAILIGLFLYWTARRKYSGTPVAAEPKKP
jgi:glutamate:GABA antiporter